jgi:Holliday junction resolvase RusA-like endonuclease
LTIHLTIPGEPVGKGRPRFTKVGRTYTPKKTSDYEKTVRDVYQDASGGYPIAAEREPVKVEILAYFGIPKSAPKKTRLAMLLEQLFPTKKPDADNIAKIIKDALNGLAYHDDAQVVVLHVEKHYSETPRVIVKLSNMKEGELV